jgi:4-hydroxy-tetrahydrodipicolinate synthase
MQLTNGDIELYSGEDGMVIPLLAAGGLGVISVLANIAPRYTHDMVMSYLNGDTKKALQMQLGALDICDALFCEVNPIPVKAAMDLMGWQVGPLREPLYQIEPQNLERLKAAMTAFGIQLA